MGLNEYLEWQKYLTSDEREKDAFINEQIGTPRFTPKQAAFYEFHTGEKLNNPIQNNPSYFRTLDAEMQSIRDRAYLQHVAENQDYYSNPPTLRDNSKVKGSSSPGYNWPKQSGEKPGYGNPWDSQADMSKFANLEYGNVPMFTDIGKFSQMETGSIPIKEPAIPEATWDAGAPRAMPTGPQTDLLAGYRRQIPSKPQVPFENNLVKRGFIGAPNTPQWTGPSKPLFNDPLVEIWKLIQDLAPKRGAWE